MKGFKIKSNPIKFKGVKPSNRKVTPEKIKGNTYKKETEFLR